MIIKVVDDMRRGEDIVITLADKYTLVTSFKRTLTRCNNGWKSGHKLNRLVSLDPLENK